MPGSGSQSGRGFGTPSSMPEGTPALASPSDHSWTLQAIMQMQKDLGVLGEKIDRLRDDFVDVKTEGTKTRDTLGEVEKSIAAARGGMKVMTGLFALSLVVLAAVLAWLFGTS